ncbi:MAG TPA: S-adenosylmethionine:tRNA ribosyltransferase-isomerase [Candidatus Cloacimonadota bacterium]|nr:S-adenosylmethionine:tRNA ribosyltransferase-isomerase [Candidatus Cloacimonadota bacterium]
MLEREAYSYNLPKELIAQHPLKTRDASRLMHVNRATQIVSHRKFADLDSLLRCDDVLVVNNSKVFPARLFGRKDNGTEVEVLLLHPAADGTWKCIVHPGKRLKSPQWLQFSESLKGFVSLGDEEGMRDISFETEGDFWEEINHIGHVPLPPYITRHDCDDDKNRYQTIYAPQ